ncbi:MAG: hypothetical protein HY776_04115 [Actinobacteria bacterium]|nr:hypothetical protein [Actinomycetota bacterium]
MERLKVIPFYTGVGTLEEVLKDKKSSSMLWLEVLFNDDIDWESYLHIEMVRVAHDKACIWYSNFKTLIESYTGRKPLKMKKGRIDNREYRKFLEALNFVTT